MGENRSDAQDSPSVSYAAGTHHDIDAERLYHALDDPPFEERVVRRTLERVAGVEEQCAVNGFGVGSAPLLVDGRLETWKTAVTLRTGSDALRAHLVYLVEPRVHVVGMQHEQPVTGGRRGQERQEQHRGPERPRPLQAAHHLCAAACAWLETIATNNITSIYYRV